MDFRNSVKRVMVVILLLFVALITYIAYFQAFRAPSIASDQGNKRLWAKRNEVLRGTIYDREGTALTSGERTGVLTQSRVYTKGDLYCHALGYVNQKYGLSGLEDSFDDELSTYSSVGNSFRDFTKDLNVDSLKTMFKERNEEEEKVGNGVVTTLDPKIQQVAYNGLKNLNGYKGAAVAINPKTGEILALISMPTYDPNSLDSVMEAANSGKDASNVLLNRALNGKYPPGSTFKTITTTSTLQNISDAKTRIFHDNGVLDLGGGYSLPNVKKVPNGDIDLKTAFMKSSNVVFGGLALELGNDKLKTTAEKYGFNKDIPSVGIEMSSSQFPKLDSNQKGLIAQSGIGQSEILATPIQMALVASTIGNDGVMMQPKLVNKVIDNNGNTVKEISDKKYQTILSKGDADTIQNYMEGLAGNLQIMNGLNAAGKTGTAENSSGKDHSWFIGFAPADNPKIAVAVIVESSGFGAEYAGPIAAQILRAGIE